MVGKEPLKPVHVAGTTRGEELVQKRGREPGRRESPVGAYRSARDATSINPGDRDPIDPSSPHIPPA
jgi:hypothetical protein